MAPSSVASDESGNDVIQHMHPLSLINLISLYPAQRRLNAHFTHSTQDGFIVDIDAIQAHGIGAVDIAKLKANGYYTIASVHAATRRNLLKIKGFSEIKVDKVKDALAKCQVIISQLTNGLSALTDRQNSHPEGGSRLRMSSVNSGSESPKSQPVASNSMPFSEGDYPLLHLPISSSHLIAGFKR
jgi:hypothetical protein